VRSLLTLYPDLKPVFVEIVQKIVSGEGDPHVLADLAASAAYRIQTPFEANGMQDNLDQQLIEFYGRVDEILERVYNMTASRKGTTGSAESDPVIIDPIGKLSRKFNVH